MTRYLTRDALAVTVAVLGPLALAARRRARRDIRRGLVRLLLHRAV